MDAEERALYMLTVHDQAPFPEKRVGFDHAVCLTHGINDPFPNNINRAIYWINTRPERLHHRFLQDLDQNCMTFWFKDADVAFEFKMRFG